MSTNVIKIKSADQIRIGNQAAQQPLSGIRQVVAVNGNAGYIRPEDKKSA